MAWPSQVGRYRITGELGRGAMGVVLRGIDPALERPVAIKLIAARPHSGVTGDEMEARFLREARVAARISHAGIVTVYDAGREGSSLYLVMELIEGESLGDRLSRGEYPEPSGALELVAKVAEALAAAHALGIVHRDVKPSNIMITTDSRVKVADFGVAKAIGEDTNLTRTGTVVGSPAYMAPEQVRGQTLDGRSDLFSLGVVLYELLLHRKPFPSETVTTLIYQILHEDPLASPDISRALGDEVAGLLRKCLAKSPDERFPDGATLAAATRSVASRLAQTGMVATHATAGRVMTPAVVSTGLPVGATPAATSQPVTTAPPVSPTGSAQPVAGGAGASSATGAPAVLATPLATATRTTGAAVSAPPPPADVASTSPTRFLGVTPGSPPPAPPPTPALQASEPQRHSALGVLLIVIGVVLLGAAVFVVVSTWPGSRTGVEAVATPPPPPTAVALVVVTATPTPQVPTPLPTFTPAEGMLLGTPTPVGEWWPTVTPTAVPNRAALVMPTAPPTMIPPTPTPQPTEPTVVATFRGQKGAKFSTSPDAAELTVNGKVIGTADDWDDAGGGKIWEPSRGVYFVKLSLKGYKTVWVKVIIDPAASDEVADVDTDLDEE